MKGVLCEGNNLPPPPPKHTHTQEELCQAELLQAILEVELHITGVSEVLRKPDTLRKRKDGSPTYGVCIAVPPRHMVSVLYYVPGVWCLYCRTSPTYDVCIAVRPLVHKNA
jgi:hypothetical protein